MASLAANVRQATSATELQALRDRIVELEELIGAKPPTRPLRALHLRPAEEIVCQLLVKQPILTHEFYMISAHGARPECDQPETRILEQYICFLRKKLKPFDIAIKTKWGAGFYLSAENKAKLAALLADRV